MRIDELRHSAPGESSQKIRERCQSARNIQAKRFAAREKASARCNARMSHSDLRKHCEITREQGDLLQHAMEQLSLSARAYDRILKVARTIADLATSEKIDTPHLLEAIQYRSLDRQTFY